jgi:N-acetyl sugar amidotransferase
MAAISTDLNKVDIQVCSRCIYDERVDGISFDESGVCNYCRQQDELVEQYGTGRAKGEAEFDRIVEEIKRHGKGRKYDCVVGVSGGTDSSYMLHLARERGLRPLAAHYDNTWNTAVSTQNIRKMLEALDVDLYTHVVDNKEADDIFRSFFLAGVAEIEASTDLALAEVMYRAAAKWGIRYALEGHSFVTEGITPLGNNYFDGKYIASIHARYGRRPMKTYPLMTFSHFLWWAVARRVQRIRPYWYIHYSKEDAMALLKEKYGWEYYGGHHLENRMTAFAHNVYFPGKFNVDFRNNSLAALARQGKLSREEAWERYNAPRNTEEGLVSYFCKRLGFSEDEFEAVMRAPGRLWTEFPSYKKRFERFRPLFAFLLKRGLVPHSFYLKYCFAKAAQ